MRTYLHTYSTQRISRGEDMVLMCGGLKAHADILTHIHTYIMQGNNRGEDMVLM